MPMKRIYLLMTMGYLFTLSLLTACHSDDVSPPIDLNTLCKTFEGDELRLYLNGEEQYGRSVAFALDKAEESDKMLLGISPLWPNVRNYIDLENDYDNIQLKIKASSDTEKVTFVSEPAIYSYYTLATEGVWSKDSLMLSLNYKTRNENLAEKSYLFDFSDESINLEHLETVMQTVDYEGLQIPIREFVADAMKIILKVWRQHFDEGLRMTFHTNGDMDMHLKSNKTYIPIPGKYGHRLHTAEYGFLLSDIEGVVIFNKLLGYSDNPFNIFDGLCWKLGNDYFLSFRYLFCEDGSNLYLSIGTRHFLHASNFFSIWTGRNVYPIEETVRGLSIEETNKVRKLSSLISNKEIIGTQIFLRGMKE